MNSNLYTANVAKTEFENLINGAIFPLKTVVVSIDAGDTYKRGDALGRTDDSEIFVRCNPSADDGSEMIRAILCDDIDLSEETDDVNVPVYVTGEFNAASVRMADDTYAEAHKLAMLTAAENGIYLSVNQPAPEYEFAN